MTKEEREAEYDKAEYNSPRPSVFIQWKGTQSCGDYYCVCGEQWHIDSDFVYFTRCPACKQTYRVGCNIVLYPIPDDEAVNVKEDTTGEFVVIE